MEASKKFYTTEEVAQRYGVKRLTVWEWIRNGKLTAMRTGKEYRMTEDDLVQFEARCRLS